MCQIRNAPLKMRRKNEKNRIEKSDNISGEKIYFLNIIKIISLLVLRFVSNEEK